MGQTYWHRALAKQGAQSWEKRVYDLRNLPAAVIGKNQQGRWSNEQYRLIMSMPESPPCPDKALITLPDLSPAPASVFKLVELGYRIGDHERSDRTGKTQRSITRHLLQQGENWMFGKRYDVVSNAYAQLSAQDAEWLKTFFVAELQNFDCLAVDRREKRALAQQQHEIVARLEQMVDTYRQCLGEQEQLRRSRS